MVSTRRHLGHKHRRGRLRLENNVNGHRCRRLERIDRLRCPVRQDRWRRLLRHRKLTPNPFPPFRNGPLALLLLRNVPPPNGLLLSFLLRCLLRCLPTEVFNDHFLRRRRRRGHNDRRWRGRGHDLLSLNNDPSATRRRGHLFLNDLATMFFHLSQ